jgi:hypothetical protein
MEAAKMENVLEIRPGVFDIKIKEKDEIKVGDNISVEIKRIEYHDKLQKRAKTVVLKIKAPSKYPIIRPEFRQQDFYSWQGLKERNNRISSKEVRRFFYKDQGKDIVEIGGYQLIILAFRDGDEAVKLREQGYVCTLRVVYPKDSLIKRG